MTEQNNSKGRGGGMLGLRVFLASPGDVAYERQIVREVIDQVGGERAFRGRVSIELIAWDKPGVGVPMEAGLTPQEAIARGLPQPADCDLVLVVLWSRIGTPLPAEYTKVDGSRYRSGTEWEYENALAGFRTHGKPSIWLYRRAEEPKIGLRDPQRKEKEDQWEKLESFLNSLTNADGSLGGGLNPYEAPDDFRRLFEQHLRDWLTQRIQAVDRNRRAPESAAQDTRTPTWTGPPYPGLTAFAEEQAPIFFGRGPEIDALVARLADRRRRFLAVVGASGTGKSSLVMAGLLPKLRQGAIPGSRDWVILPRFTPALEGSPLCGLGSALSSRCAGIDEPGGSLAERLAADPEAFAELAASALAGKPDWAELLVFVDQFEELVTLVPEAEREPFVRVLERIAQTPRVRVLVTLRADFAHRIDAWPALVDLRNGDGTYILKQPGLHALRRMIEGPAQKAGATLEAGLADRIIEDTGTEPGSFALMAFTLERLYAICQPEPLLTEDAYWALDGVRGSIAHQADRAFAAVGEPARDALPRVFRELVSVSPYGTATRRRASLEAVAGTMPAAELVQALIEARLLVAEEKGRVEVAHEKLFDAWGRLERWIGESADDLRLIEKVRLEAADWVKDGRASKYLWRHEKLQDVAVALVRLGIERSDLDPDCQDFIRPEAERLLAELADIEMPHNHRAWIGDRLAEIGDPRLGVGVSEGGTPVIDWVAIPGGEVVVDVGYKADRVRVAPFHMARYLVTNAQFQAFWDAADGYRKPDWWEDMPEEANKNIWRPKWGEPNRPRESVSWYEAIAFCRWLSDRLGIKVRLPTEHEWQRAATGGDASDSYPWGPEWDARRCNTSASRLAHTTAVGMYPSGCSLQGVYDLSGNLWEWCLSKWEKPQDTAVDASDEPRVLRGSSWDGTGDWAPRGDGRLYRPVRAKRATTTAFVWCVPPPSADHWIVAHWTLNFCSLHHRRSATLYRRPSPPQMSA